MSEVINCGFARVFVWESQRQVRDSTQKKEGEPSKQFLARVNDERYILFREQFSNFPSFDLKRGTCKN
jgi:hypothetical protein